MTRARWDGEPAVACEDKRATSTRSQLVELVAAGLPPLPGSGRTRARFDALAEASRPSLSVGRLFEAHVDAIAILTEAGAAGDEARLTGVWASDRTGHVRVERGSSGWRLHGTKPFCSGATFLDRALVTASSPGGVELALVDLDDPGVRVEPSTWRGPGMTAADTRAVCFDGASCTLVGPSGWYLERAGFWHGAVGVAASWFGGALGVLDTFARGVHEDDPHQLSLLGEAAALHYAMEATLCRGAEEIDLAPADRVAARVRALGIRRVVASGCLEVLRRANDALGPRALAHDEAHGRRAADLEVYVRQEHGRHDSEQLGRAIIGAEPC